MKMEDELMGEFEKNGILKMKKTRSKRIEVIREDPDDPWFVHWEDHVGSKIESIGILVKSQIPSWIGQRVKEDYQRC
jgi:hypothetical protein